MRLFSPIGLMRDSCSAASTTRHAPLLLGDPQWSDYHCVMAPDSLRPQRQAILEVAARHGARNVPVFGSIARGDDRPNSDVDLLVEVEAGRTLLDVIALEQDLEELLGRPVGLLTDAGLSPCLQERILAEALALRRTTASTSDISATRSTTSRRTRARDATLRKEVEDRGQSRDHEARGHRRTSASGC